MKEYRVIIDFEQTEYYRYEETVLAESEDEAYELGMAEIDFDVSPYYLGCYDTKVTDGYVQEIAKD